MAPTLNGRVGSDAEYHGVLNLDLVPAPIAHATRSEKRLPNRMVNSRRTRVRREFTVVLVFLLVFYFKFSVGISVLNILQVNTSELPRPVRDDI